MFYVFTDPCIDNIHGYYLHRSNCNSYWVCDGDRTKELRCCPLGMSFDLEKRRCVISLCTQTCGLEDKQDDFIPCKYKLKNRRKCKAQRWRVNSLEIYWYTSHLKMRSSELKINNCHKPMDTHSTKTHQKDEFCFLLKKYSPVFSDCSTYATENNLHSSP